MNKILCFIALFTIIFSCKKVSSEIDQSKIFQSYTMIYDEGTNKTNVSAYFFEEKDGGKNLELSGSSSVTMNGAAMSKSGQTYFSLIDGNLASAVVVFTDTEGKTYTNTLSKANFISNESSTDLSKSISSYWYWGGTTIVAGETINIKFINVADNTKNASFTETTLSKSYLTLHANS